MTVRNDTYMHVPVLEGFQADSAILLFLYLDAELVSAKLDLSWLNPLLWCLWHSV